MCIWPSLPFPQRAHVGVQGGVRFIHFRHYFGSFYFLFSWESRRGRGEGEMPGREEGEGPGGRCVCVPQQLPDTWVTLPKQGRIVTSSCFPAGRVHGAGARLERRARGADIADVVMPTPWAQTNTNTREPAGPHVEGEEEPITGFGVALRGDAPHSTHNITHGTASYALHAKRYAHHKHIEQGAGPRL